MNENEQSQPIDKAFAYHKPSEKALGDITEIRQSYTFLKAQIEALCPASRERSVALTELETSAMWAIKAVVHNDPESEVQP